MKLIAVLLLLAATAAQASDLDCDRDDRPVDGDKVQYKAKLQADGTYTVLYSAAASGRRPTPPPAPIVDQVVATGLICQISQADPRIRSCANADSSASFETQLVSRSQLVSQKPHATHIMNDSLELAVWAPGFARQQAKFAPKNCRVN